MSASNEEILLQKIVQRFGFLENAIRIARTKRLFLEVNYESFAEVFEYVVKELGFNMLCAITALDEGEMFGIMYNLAHPNGIMLNVKTRVERAHPNIQTVTAYFPQADVYEREIVDLFGIIVSGLSEGSRYPLPDEWPKNEFPLRKDWKHLEQGS